MINGMIGEDGNQENTARNGNTYDKTSMNNRRLETSTALGEAAQREALALRA